MNVLLATIALGTFVSTGSEFELGGCDYPQSYELEYRGFAFKGTYHDHRNEEEAIFVELNYTYQGQTNPIRFVLDDDSNESAKDLLTIFLKEIVDEYLDQGNRSMELQNRPLLRFQDLKKGMKVVVVETANPTQPITGPCVVTQWLKYLTPLFIVEINTGDVFANVNIQPEMYRFIEEI